MLRFAGMHKTLAILFLAATAAAHAQYRRQPVPSPFDVFISKPGIEWAAYADDTIRFNELNKILIQQFAKNAIKASLPVYRDISDLNHIEFLKPDTLNKIVLYPGNICPIYDSNGNSLFDPGELKPYPVDTSRFTVTAVTQIWYVENGVLKSKIPWVSISSIPISTSSGVFLGYTAYFSTCFSFGTAVDAGSISSTNFLSQTVRRIPLDSTNAENRLKETYGRNLVETLWPYVIKDRFKLYAYETRKTIKAAGIRYLREYLQLPVPRFDADGNKEASDFGNPEVNPSIFKYADIVQEWYYDVTRNIVVSKVKELILLGFKGDREERRYFPVLKLSF